MGLLSPQELIVEVKLNEAEFWRMGLENFANVVTPVVGFLTAGIAWWGVWSWRGHQKWARSQELGKHVLLNLRKYESEVEHLINPAATLGRTFGKLAFRPDLTGEELKLEQHKAMYDDFAHQSKQIDAAKADLDAVLDEAEIFWGAEVSRWLEGLNKLQIELVNYRILSSLAWHPDSRSVTHQQGQRYITKHRAPSNSKIGTIGISNSRETTEFQNEWQKEISNLRSKVRKQMEQLRYS